LDVGHGPRPSLALCEQRGGHRFSRRGDSTQAGARAQRMGILYGEPIWHPNAEISPEGLKFAMEIYAEQAKGPPPDPLKYIDMSFLQQAIRELN
jgi:hypothetical protein